MPDANPIESKISNLKFAFAEATNSIVVFRPRPGIEIWTFSDANRIKHKMALIRIRNIKSRPIA
jgi:hypothetical protein